MEKAYRFRIYPDEAQKVMIAKTLGCCRWVYNHYLTYRKEEYENNQRSVSYQDCSGELTKQKKQDDTIWLQEVDSTALQSALKNLDKAYDNFFRGCKTGENIGYPQYKCKRDHNQSYTSKFVNNNIQILDGAIRLPKLGIVKCKYSREVNGRIQSVTVRRNAAEHYYVSIQCTDVEIEQLPKTSQSVGVDLGIKDYVVTSNGEKYPNNRYLSKGEKKIIRLQKSLSRKQKGSNNREKERKLYAKAHERVTNQRSDMIHKITTELVKRYDVICIEDLAVKNMVKNHKLAKSISDASWGEFKRQLLYKAEWYGKKVIIIDRLFPSSQTCSCCHVKWEGTKDLKVRVWTCSSCGATHDRDMNAAINILSEGLRIAASI